MGIRITLVKSIAGASEQQLRTVAGLGLRRMGQVRLIEDTPATRGMVFKVRHLVLGEAVTQEPVATVRRKPRHVRAREAARARRAAKQGSGKGRV